MVVVMMVVVVLSEVPNVTKHDQRGRDVVLGRLYGRALPHAVVPPEHQLS